MAQADTGVPGAERPGLGDLVLGTAGWSYDSWVGPFYPEGLAAREYLSYYAGVFGAVEVDSTFYAIPRPDVVRRWAEVTPEGFQFCPKMVQTVTHELKLQDAQEETERFLEVLSLLGSKLGPIVLQFDYTFGPDNLGLLDAYLEGLPGQHRFAVEVRNRGWLKDTFYQMLVERGVALVLQDLHYMPRLQVITADFTYIRWLGRRADVPSDFSRVVRDRSRELDWWAERVKEWLGRGIRVYAFANNRYQGHAPATVRAFQARLALAE